MTEAIIIVVVAIILIIVGKRLLLSRGLARIPEMNDDALKALFDRPRNVQLFQKASAELKSRDVDLGFILPHFIEMVLSNNTTNMMLGWAGLKEFFSDQVEGVDLSTATPTSEARIRLKEIKMELGF